MGPSYTAENARIIASPLITGTSEETVVSAPVNARRVTVYGLVVANAHAAVGTWVAVRLAAGPVDNEWLVFVGPGQTVVVPLTAPVAGNPGAALRAQCTTAAAVRVSAHVTIG